VELINQAYDPEQLLQTRRDVERLVLARAVEILVERPVF
jgi:formyltetrahydrofolate hydrolase